MSSYYQDPHTPDRVGANYASILREKIAEYVLKLLVPALLREVTHHFPVPYAAPRITPDPAFSPLASVKDCDMNVGSATMSATTDT